MTKNVVQSSVQEAAEYDVIVVGAGWFGLGSCRAYLETHPGENILLIEASGSCGGTWSEDRIYPGLKTNNLYDAYQFPDFPMTEAVYGVNAGSHIPGGVMHRYLTDYAKHFKIFERCRFNTRCVKLEPNEAIDGWTVTTTPDGQPTKTSTLTTRKVILATGLTSTPNLPTYAGADKFNAPIFHAKDFCRRADTLASSKSVVVVGGAKSAYDVAWAYADAGAQVHIVMRPDGNGPIWISRPWVMGGKKRLEKLLHVRFMQWFSPCPWAEDTFGSWPRRFLHGTKVGRWIVDKFWATLGADVLEVNGWKQTDETKKMIPWNSPFWIASGLSIHNYETDFFDMVKDGRVKIHVENIDHLSEKAVHLTNGTKLDADVLVCSTGWKKESTIEFSKFGTAGIGLPQDKQEQMKLSAAADHQILEMYPRLKNQPELKFKPKYDPFRLYRFMVPPARVQDHNIAFAGMVSSVSTAVCSAVQGLWISAFFDGHLDRLATTQKDVTDEVMLHTTFFKWKVPTGYGFQLPDFAFDAVPYHDLLMKDLGLNWRRKKGLIKDLTEPYGPDDYQGIYQEYHAKNDSKKKQ